MASLPTTTEEKEDTETVEVTRSNSLTHESKRKQAHPHKNTQPVKKPRGRKRKLDDDADASATTATPAESKVALKTSPAKRGRPPKKRPTVDTDAAAKAAVVEKSVAPSIINSQLTNAPQVSVPRIEVNVSPVKILQENPLLVAPTPNSMSVARKINFPGNDVVEDKPASTDSHVDDDIDVIESSQSSDSGDAKHRAKRKRKSIDSAVDSKPLLPRPSELNFCNLFKSTKFGLWAPCPYLRSIHVLTSVSFASVLHLYSLNIC